LAWLVAGAAGAAGAGGGRLYSISVDADMSRARGVSMGYMSRARGVRRATGDARGVARVPSSKFNASSFGKTQRFNWLVGAAAPATFRLDKGLLCQLRACYLGRLTLGSGRFSVCHCAYIHRLQQYVLGASATCASRAARPQRSGPPTLAPPPPLSASLAPGSGCFVYAGFGSLAPDS
jgi:hypothetical protein